MSSSFEPAAPRRPGRITHLHLYIGNLSYLTTAEELAGLLAPFGPIAPPELAIDPATGLPRGYALCYFDDEAAALAAVAALNGTVLRGRVLVVRPAHADEEGRC